MTTHTHNLHRVAMWLRKPPIILLGVVSGMVIGVSSPDVARQLAPFGNLYLMFLRMCVIPIMVTAVISSFGRLLSSKEAGGLLKRIAVVFCLGLLVTALGGLTTAIVTNPGAALSPENRGVIGTVLMSAGGSIDFETTMHWNEFVEMMIPPNIFRALAEGNSLQILFFSLVFGFALGMVSSASREPFLELTEVVLQAMEKVIATAMYLLPFGLLSMIAGQVADAGLQLLLAMIKYVVAIYIAVGLMVLLGAIVISLVQRQSFYQSISAFREPLVVGFGTSNSYATMPAILEALRGDSRLSPQAVNLAVPLSIVICRYSMILVFTVGSVFVAQLYGIPLNIQQYAIIFFGSLLGALASAGAPGIVALSMISLVLVPLGLPVDTALLLLLAANFVVDPALTVVNVYLSSAVAVVIAKRPDQSTAQQPRLLNTPSGSIEG